MACRYCPECGEWLETAEYTVDETGETICPEDGHPAVHGYIGYGATESELRRSVCGEEEIEQAKRQNLI
jgi:hypothetical protein